MSGKPQKLIQALLVAKTLADAARQVGVCERTARRWMQTPDFRAAYDQARSDAFDRTLARLQAVSSEAVDVLAETMKTGTPTGKIRAAAIVLRLCVDVRMADVLARMDQLERFIVDTRNGEIRP